MVWFWKSKSSPSSSAYGMSNNSSAWVMHLLFFFACSHNCGLWQSIGAGSVVKIPTCSPYYYLHQKLITSYYATLPNLPPSLRRFKGLPWQKHLPPYTPHNNCPHSNNQVERYVRYVMNSPILSNSSPPDAYSRNKYSMGPSLRLPKNLIIFSCSSILWIWTSFLTVSAASGCCCKLIILRATSSLVLLFTNNLTLWKREEILINILEQSSHKSHAQLSMQQHGIRHTSESQQHIIILVVPTSKPVYKAEIKLYM